MVYATVNDVQARMTRQLTQGEQAVCGTLLEDAAVLIDAAAPDANEDAKKVVSCRVVIRAVGSDESVPIGASQGSQSALGYTQSWTMGTGGSIGELYLAKTDKRLLGVGNQVGSYSPVQELVPEDSND